jgi:dynein heavy chain
LIDDGVFKIKDVVEEQAGIASGEANIENTVAAIADVWSKMNFITVNYRDIRDRYIIGTIDEILAQLEDH